MLAGIEKGTAQTGLADGGRSSLLLLTTDPQQAAATMHMLQEGGYRATMIDCTEAEAVQAALDRFNPDAVLVDGFEEQAQGEQLLQLICSQRPQPVVVLIISPGQERFARRALELGAVHCLYKLDGGAHLQLLPPLLEAARRLRAGASRECKHDFSTVDAAQLELQQIIDAAAPLCVLDADCRVQLANKGMCEKFGLTKREIVGMTCCDLWDNLANHEECLVKKAIETRSRIEVERTVRSQDGRATAFVVAVQPCYAPDGAVVGAVATLTDISEQKAKHEELERYREHLELVVKVRTAELAAANARLQQDLEERKRAEARLREYAGQLENANRCLEQYSFMAQAASRAKSEFLSNVSHEMRTPLHGIIGLTETILTAKDLASAHRQAQVILDESEHLLGLINDLLDDAKIEQGKLELESRPFDLRRMLQSVERSEGLQARHKGLEFRLEVGDDVPQFVVGDVLRLRQIILNLVGNAIKFTEEGWVRVRVNRVGTVGDSAALRFAVEDTGIGIPLEKQQLIFESFTQVDGSTTRKYGGSGLGISIARKLVHLMGGEMKLQSEPGKGSTFWFIISLPVCSQPPAPEELATLPDDEAEQESRDSAAAKQILLVDDYPTN